MSEGHDNQDPTGAFDRFAKTVRKRIVVVVGCCMLTGIGALAFSLVQEKQYSATATLLFKYSASTQALFGSGFASPPIYTAPERVAATNVGLVSSQQVASRTARALGGHMTGSGVAGMISVEAQGASELASVVATAPKPRTAQRVANIYARHFIAFQAETEKKNFLHAQELALEQYRALSAADQASPEGRSLRKSAERLGVMATLQTGNVQLAKSASLPGSPSSPRTKLNTVMGAILGLLLGIALAFLLERLNRRLREPEEVRDAYDLPVLASIPESEALSAHSTTTPLLFAEEEAFRTLRASLRYFSNDGPSQSVLVTSALPREGKSTVAWNLARAGASHSRTLIIDADLRRSSMAFRHSDIAEAPGLSELLSNQVALAEVLQTVTFSEADGYREATMDVIAAGHQSPDPTKLLESQSLAYILSELRNMYDFIVVDTPPAGVISEVFPLFAMVDGVVLVAALNLTTRDAARKMRERMDRLDAPLIGVVANRAHRKRGDYSYGDYAIR